MLKSIEGRSVIVTGASRGIGKGIARVFAAKGAQVLVVARNIGPAEATANEIRASGGKALAFGADVSRWPEAERIAAEAVARIRRHRRSMRQCRNLPGGQAGRVNARVLGRGARH